MLGPLMSALWIPGHGTDRLCRVLLVGLGAGAAVLCPVGSCVQGFGSLGSTPDPGLSRSAPESASVHEGGAELVRGGAHCTILPAFPSQCLRCHDI